MSQNNGLWIPSEIWNDAALTVVQKVILSQIVNYVTSGLQFYQSNETLAADMAVSVSTVKRSLGKLISDDYVTVESFNGRKRLLTLSNKVQIEPAASSKRPGRKLKKHRQEAQSALADGANRTTIKKATKKSIKKPNDVKEKLLYPFDDFAPVWDEWVQYKKEEHRFTFKTTKTEQTALHYLQKISNNDRHTAIQIIGRSIANGYKGLFANRDNGKTAPTASPDQLRDYIQNG